MKLYEKYPSHVTVNGKRVRLNLEYRRVLRMVDILDRQDLLPDAREWLAMKCICRRPRKGMVMPVLDMLFPKATIRERITDFGQDADLIRAAFRQVYGINLDKDKIGWFEFIALLSGLPDGTRYGEILTIRAKPMPEPTKYNQKEREYLAKAKTEYALKMTEKEQADKYQRDVQALGDFLMMFAGE